MNIIDEMLDSMAGNDGVESPYKDKSDWNWLDYIMLYGLPSAVLFCVVMAIKSLF